MSSAELKLKTHDLHDIYEQVPPDYWDNAYKITNPIQWFYHFWRFRAIRHMLAVLPRNAKILDVGCGSGFAIEQSVKNRPDLEVYGVDVAPNLIDYAQKYRPRFNFVLAKGEELPFDNETFDAILYLDVIEHLVNPGKSLDEARRALKPNGFTVILVVLEGHPVFQIIWKIWLKMKGKVWHDAHLHIFTKENLKKLLNEHGFAIAKPQNLYWGMSVLIKAKKI